MSARAAPAPSSSAPLWARALGPLGCRFDAADPADLGAAAEQAAAGFALWPVAVGKAARRREDQVVLDGALAQRAPGEGPLIVPVLEHAGPAAAAWSEERPVGPADVASPFGGRRPQPLGEGGWAVEINRFRTAAGHLRRAGVPLALVAVDRGGLLASTVSPLSNPEAGVPARLARVRAVVEAVAAEVEAVGISLCVEEGAPGGLDPTGGVEVAEAALEAGAALAVVSAGSRWLPRRGGLDVDAAVASAAWLGGRPHLPVWAEVDAGRAAEPLAGVATTIRRARDAGLAGVVLVEDELGGRP